MSLSVMIIKSALNAVVPLHLSTIKKYDFEKQIESY